MAQRVSAINPDCVVHEEFNFLNADNAHQLLDRPYTVIIVPSIAQNTNAH